MDASDADRIARQAMLKDHALVLGSLRSAKLIPATHAFALSCQKHDWWFLNYDRKEATFGTPDLDVLTLTVNCVTNEVNLMPSL